MPCSNIPVINNWMQMKRTLPRKKWLILICGCVLLPLTGGPGICQGLPAAEIMEGGPVAQPGYGALLSQGMHALKAEDYNRAQDLLTQAKSCEDRDERVYEQLGYLYAAQRELVKAQQSFEQALVSAPANVRVRLALVEIYRRTQHFQKAQSFLTQTMAMLQQQESPEGLRIAQEMQAELDAAMSKGDGPRAAVSSEAGLAALLGVLNRLGYDVDAAKRIAKPLFHLYNNFPSQGSLPVDKMRHRLEEQVRAIQKDFITQSVQGNGINPAHAKVYGLLLNSPAHKEFFEEFVQYYKLLSQADKDYVDRAFQCSYKSYLGWLFLTAKGFDVIPVITYLENEQREYIVEQKKKELGVLSFSFSQGEDVADNQRQAHVSLIVKLAEDQFVYVDVTNSFVSELFSSKDYFCDRAESRCTFLLEGRKDIFRSILLIDQERIRAILYAYLAGFYSIAGKDQAAVDCLNEALAFAEDFGYLYHKLGLFYYQEGDKDRFLSFLKKSVEQEPYNDMFAFFLGKAYLFQDDFDAAMTYFERAILNYSRDPSYYEALAYAHTRKSQWPEAVRHYQTVIYLDADYPKAYTLLGLAYMKWGESQYRSKYYSKAESSFESALECFEQAGNQDLVQEARKALTFVR